MRKRLATDDGAPMWNMHNRVGAVVLAAMVRGTATAQPGRGLELLRRLVG